MGPAEPHDDPGLRHMQPKLEAEPTTEEGLEKRPPATEDSGPRTPDAAGSTGSTRAPSATRAWKQVWDARRLDPSRGSTLSQLLAADGFDTGFAGDLQAPAWTAFVRHWARTLGLKPGDSVHEVGCGAGAFLYELARAGLAVTGSDQSATLVAIARDALPNGTFEVAPACDLDITARADAVVSCGMFPYLASLDYAATVITRMTAKARRAVAILDIPDQAKQAAALKYRIASAGGETAYADRYEGLDHLHYPRSWIARSLQEAGLTDIQIADQSLPGYGNASFRFNGWAFKPPD